MHHNAPSWPLRFACRGKHICALFENQHLLGVNRPARIEPRAGPCWLAQMCVQLIQEPRARAGQGRATQAGSSIVLRSKQLQIMALMEVHSDTSSVETPCTSVKPTSRAVRNPQHVALLCMAVQGQKLIPCLAHRRSEAGDCLLLRDKDEIDAMPSVARKVIIRTLSPPANLSRFRNRTHTATKVRPTVMAPKELAAPSRLTSRESAPQSCRVC